jgi:multisubunit Na+/H+ antiporter MnhF subunit
VCVLVVFVAGFCDDYPGSMALWLLLRCLQGPVLKDRIIGQDDAVESVVAALCRYA